ncbi:MAG: ExbD/TolR family protein [Gammaproteobacteria bacterium]|nr:MAG: ExbD/TolR family protein [Gammaproteobacteria bacterium]TND06843.1 MAG: ExbD/TolR family protein [Gammaproteobacteria bacterium]
MNFRSSRSEEPDVNLTPLIDVVFLLLIFFMVSTTFKRESQLNIDLPRASAQPVETGDRPLEITIDAEGRIFVNQQGLVNNQLATLMKAMQQAVGERTDIPLIISADGKTPHQAVVTAMDAARKLGITHLSLATQHNE